MVQGIKESVELAGKQGIYRIEAGDSWRWFKAAAEPPDRRKEVQPEFGGRKKGKEYDGDNEGGGHHAHIGNDAHQVVYP